MYFFKHYAIKKDISVGIAQIKISTASKILHQDPDDFISKLLKDDFNIDICGRYLRDIVKEYDYILETEENTLPEWYSDVFDYIACQYLGGTKNTEKRTVLIYSTVLRSVSSQDELSYLGSNERSEYYISLTQFGENVMKPSEFDEFINDIRQFGFIKKEIYKEHKEIYIELYSRDHNCYEIILNCAKDYNASVELG